MEVIVIALEVSQGQVRTALAALVILEVRRRCCSSENSRKEVSLNHAHLRASLRQTRHRNLPAPSHCSWPSACKAAWMISQTHLRRLGQFMQPLDLFSRLLSAARQNGPLEGIGRICFPGTSPDSEPVQQVFFGQMTLLSPQTPCQDHSALFFLQ